MAGRGPRAAPVSLLEPTLKTAVLALSNQAREAARAGATQLAALGSEYATLPLTVAPIETRIRR